MVSQRAESEAMLVKCCQCQLACNLCIVFIVLGMLHVHKYYKNEPIGHWVKRCHYFYTITFSKFWLIPPALHEVHAAVFGSVRGVC